MNSDNEQDEPDRATRRDIELKIERFREQSQVYLCRLPLLKRQLREINRLQQFDLYVQKLDDIGKVVQTLAQNIRSLEHLHLQLSDKDRQKLDQQIRLLRVDVDCEMSAFQEYNCHSNVTSINDETRLSHEENGQGQTPESDTAANELRQRSVAKTNNLLNESYDLLVQDLILLHDTMDEVAELVARHRQPINHTDSMIHSAQVHIQQASSLLQKAVHNKYITVASGALLGASLGGPVGFLMGMKIGALAALSGSAVGALSANIMQQRALREGEAKKNDRAYPQAML